MKKVVKAVTIAGLILSTPIQQGQAFFGGGIDGPIPVYSVDTTVDLATIATQVNTLQQLEAALKNLSSMDVASAAANMGQIQQTLAQLQAVQQQATGLTMDYQNFQQQWDQTYPDYASYTGMSGADYANQVQQLSEVTQKQIYDAMLAQGLVSQVNGDARNLQSLLSASQSAEGALAAAQAGNQIAAITSQQLMRLQQIVAQSNQAQLSYQEEQKRKERMAKEAMNQYFEREQ